jgi:hypothetical protein
MQAAIRSIGSTILLLVLAGPALAGPTPAGKCAAAKSNAASRKIAAKLKCSQKAYLAGTSVDPDCLSRADEKFTGAIAKVEAKGGCVVTGDATRLEAAADTCVGSVDTLTPALPTCGADLSQCNASACPAGSTCEVVFGGPCQCVPSPPCSGSAAPACNGDCGPGSVCVDLSGSCACTTPCPALACGASPVGCADGLSICNAVPTQADCNCIFPHPL